MEGGGESESQSQSESERESQRERERERAKEREREKGGIAIIRHLVLQGTGCHLKYFISCCKTIFVEQMSRN